MDVSPKDVITTSLSTASLFCRFTRFWVAFGTHSTVCRLMVDKITIVPKSRIGAHLGRFADDDIVRLNRAALLFLGIASSKNHERLES